MKFEKVIAILEEEIKSWGVDYEHWTDKGKKQIDDRVNELRWAKQILSVAAEYNNPEKAKCILENATSIECLACIGCGFEAPGRNCSACGGHGVINIQKN